MKLNFSSRIFLETVDWARLSVFLIDTFESPEQMQITHCAGKHVHHPDKLDNNTKIFFVLLKYVCSIEVGQSVCLFIQGV